MGGGGESSGDGDGEVGMREPGAGNRKLEMTGASRSWRIEWMEMGPTESCRLWAQGRWRFEVDWRLGDVHCGLFEARLILSWA